MLLSSGTCAVAQREHHGAGGAAKCMVGGCLVGQHMQGQHARGKSSMKRYFAIGGEEEEEGRGGY